MRSIFYSTLALLALWSCTDPGPDFPEGEVIGYRPVYASEVNMTISMEASREPENTGKIFLQGNVLLLSEVNKGIHIINNEDPSNPVSLGFLAVSGSTDFSFRDNILYVNQFTDIVSIDFSDLNNIREIGRETSAFSLSASNQLVPPLAGYYFECVDAGRGNVVDWQLTTITDPKCYR